LHSKIELKDDVTFNTQVELNNDATNIELDLGENTITFDNVNAFMLKKGTLTVKNGKLVNVSASTHFIFTFDANASYARNATLNLTDVEIDATDNERPVYFKSNANAQHSQHTLNLTDVTLNATANSDNRMIYSDGANHATVNIYSGNYTGTCKYLSYNESANVYGGTFTDKNVKNYVADGYKVVTNDNNGRYSVVEDTVVNVTDDLEAVYADGNETYTYRFFAVIADYELYAKAGFKVTAIVSGEEYEWNIELNEVYETVNVNDTDYDAEGYILTGAIGEVPTDDVKFTVVPYVVDFEGNEIEL